MGCLHLGILDLEIKRLSMLVYKWLLGSHVYNDKRLGAENNEKPYNAEKKTKRKSRQNKVTADRQHRWRMYIKQHLNSFIA